MSSSHDTSQTPSAIHDRLRGGLSMHDASTGSVSHAQSPIPHAKTLSLDILYIGTKNLAEQQLVEREMKRIVANVTGGALLESVTGETFSEHPAERASSISWQYKAISSGKLRRYFSLENFTDVGRIMAGFFQSYLALNSFKPNLVFCKGGYVTVPVAAAARLLNIPVWIHESDVSPGLATKINSRFAQKIFVSFKETKKYFKDFLQKKIEVVGNPIRAAVTQGDAQRARDFTGLHEKIPTILVMGGSLGSQFINDTLSKSLDELLKDFTIIHITGAGAKPLINHPRYRAYEFLHEQLPDCYALTDCIVSRSGSGSVFECAAVGKPTLFIPLSKAASRGDQIENAYAAAQCMNAKVLEQEKLEQDPSCFASSVKSLFLNTSQKKAALQTNAAHVIVDFLVSVPE